jgi:hypothetical protein
MSSDLELFLVDNSLGVQIYQILKKDYPDVDPVAFFNTIVTDRDYLIENYRDYLKIEKYFEKPELPEELKSLMLFPIYIHTLNTFDSAEYNKEILKQSLDIIYKSAIKAYSRFQEFSGFVFGTIGDFDFQRLKLEADSLNINSDKKTLVTAELNRCKEWMSDGSNLNEGLEFISNCNDLIDAINIAIAASKETIQTYSAKPIIEPKNLTNKLETAKALLLHFQGVNVHGREIMNKNHFNVMMESVGYLIETNAVPPDIKSIPKLDLSNDYIRYTFYKIHDSIYGTLHFPSLH